MRFGYWYTEYIRAYLEAGIVTIIFIVVMLRGLQKICASIIRRQIQNDAKYGEMYGCEFPGTDY